MIGMSVYRCASYCCDGGNMLRLRSSKYMVET
jgi:hypothetical protein